MATDNSDMTDCPLEVGVKLQESLILTPMKVLPCDTDKVKYEPMPFAAFVGG
jgi:hypothetical protein